MIWLYAGVPGSGKSLFATGELLQWLASGLTVVANFPVTTENLPKLQRRIYGRGRFLYRQRPTVAELVQISRSFKPRRERQGLLVIDEAGVFFNPRQSPPDMMDWIRFFSQHRKLGWEVILIAQRAQMIDKQIYGCVETERRFRSSRSFSRLLPRLFVGLDYYAVDRKDSQAAILHRTVFRYHRLWASVYDTFALFGSSGPDDSFLLADPSPAGGS